MSKFDEMVAMYEGEMKELKIAVNSDLLKAVPELDDVKPTL